MAANRSKGTWLWRVQLLGMLVCLLHWGLPHSCWPPQLAGDLLWLLLRTAMARALGPWAQPWAARATTKPQAASTGLFEYVHEIFFGLFQSANFRVQGDCRLPLLWQVAALLTLVRSFDAQAAALVSCVAGDSTIM
jgi:hypothetical protein